MKGAATRGVSPAQPPAPPARDVATSAPVNADDDPGHDNLGCFTHPSVLRSSSSSEEDEYATRPPRPPPSTRGRFGAGAGAAAGRRRMRTAGGGSAARAGAGAGAARTTGGGAAAGAAARARRRTPRPVLGARGARGGRAALLRLVERDVLGVEHLARAEQRLRVRVVGLLLLLPLGLELLVERLAAAAAGRARRAHLVGLEDLGLAVRQAVGAAQDLGGDEADGHGWVRFCRAAALESARCLCDQHCLRGRSFTPKVVIDLNGWVRVLPRFRAVPVGCLQSPHGLVAGGGAKVLPDSTMTKLLSDGKWRCPPPTTSELLHPHLAEQAVDAEQLFASSPAAGCPRTAGMGQPLHLRGCLLLAAASYGAAPDARARARLRGPARLANASSALVLKDRRLPAPTSRALVARRRRECSRQRRL